MMTVWTRRPALRWLVPIAVVAVILGGSAVTSAVRASAGSDLPPRSPAQLLADLRLARLDGGTGTVVEHADLGIPALPAGLGGDGSAQFDSLIAGAHTLRVWYSGPKMARIALVGALGESDIVRNDADLWVWSSTDNTATHATVPAAPANSNPSPMPLTPLDAANRVLAALAPTTSVTTSGSVTVAGRAAYQLVIAPKDPASLVGSVRIALDADRHVPLRVQIFAAGAAKPAFEIGFTQVSFTKPDPSVFHFNPPPGAKVNQAGSGGSHSEKPPAMPTTKPRVIGQGWTAVLEATLPSEPGGSKGTLDRVFNALPTVHGGFGTGKLLQTALFSVLLTNDGRVFIGSVSGTQLVATAGK